MWTFPTAIGWARLALAGFTTLAAAGQQVAESSIQALPAAPTSAIKLDIEERGGAWNIRWNPQDAAVREAREARLEIQESNQRPFIIPMDTRQLADGHLLYGSSAEVRQFRLEIVDKTGKISDGSLPASSAKTRRPLVQATPAQTTPAQVTPVQTSPAQPAPTWTAQQLPGASARSTPVSLPAPPANAPPAERPQNPKPITVDGNVQAAKLVKRVSPVYPAEAVTSHIEGDVRFIATIGKDGSVRDLQTVSGEPILVAAAAEAARQWVYRPSTIKGVPTEVVTQIEVRFALK